MKKGPDEMQPEPGTAAGDGELPADQAPVPPFGDDARKAEEYLKHLQRVQADFVNYKRRMEQEKVEQAKYANSVLLQKLLPALDDLERAVESVPPTLEDNTWVQGIELIERKIRQALEAEGVEKIPALGVEFDPNVHEAVLHHSDNPETENKVTAVFQAGYKLHDRVIRPAVVKVGGAPEGPWPPKPQTERFESKV